MLKATEEKQFPPVMGGHPDKVSIKCKISSNWPQNHCLNPNLKTNSKKKNGDEEEWWGEEKEEKGEGRWKRSTNQISLDPHLQHYYKTENTLNLYFLSYKDAKFQQMTDLSFNTESGEGGGGEPFNSPNKRNKGTREPK